ncbi:tubulin-tyrosine ligase family-domain-containing protein [Scenedesmus sp. NREL 46B-D3]|nr:tubulin-tyrosine ligase family-domain-containing protein [Scenedesmus sp. NREL 46B-D3]
MFYSLLDRDPVLDAIPLQLGPLIVARQLFALRSLLSACRIRNQVSVMKLLTYIVLVYAMTAACVHGAEEQQQQQCSMQSEAVFGPKVHFPDDGQYNDNVREVLLAMGFTSTENAADANLIWARWDLFEKNQGTERMRKAHEQLKRLSNHQLVNQARARPWLLTVKQELAKLSNSIRAIPRTFKMPEEYASWQGFVNAEEGSGMEWIQKSTAHRGVQIITDTAAPELQQLQGVLVQQLVRPRLIGGRAWDVGVYVAITQLEPLTAYVFAGSALLRFCSKPYQRDITQDTDRSTYVVTGLDDFTPGPEVDAMQPHYNDAYADTTMGSSMSLAH